MPQRVVLRPSDAAPASPELRFLERLAEADRATLRLRFGEPCDPRRLVEFYDVCLIVETFTDYDAFLDWGLDDALTVFDGLEGYSAIMFATSPSDHWILVNPRNEKSRRTLTIAHEFGHLVLGHHPVSVDCAVGGLVTPRYSDAQEHQAYCYGLALLLPYAPLLQFLEAAIPHPSVAKHYGVSVEALNMRLKLAGLWDARASG